MKTGLFLSAAAASLLMLGAPAVFAQTYAAPSALQLKPGQTYAPDAASLAPSGTVVSAAHIVTLKPGETVQTAGAQDLGATEAASAQAASGSFTLLKPGEAG